MRRAHCVFSLFLAAGLWPAAPALAADPTTADCLAASDASLRLGNEHKLRAERSQLLVCASANCPMDIRKECLNRVEELNGQIPTIVFSAKGPDGSDLSTVKVTMDDEVVAERLEGTALSIDPGEHTFTFETAGQAPVTKKLVITEAQKDRRELVTFGSPTPPPPSFPFQPPPVGSPAPESSSGLGPQKIGAIVAGGVGVVGIGLGTIFGLMAASKKNDAQSVCPDRCATQDGVQKWNDASSAATVSTVGFIVGGVGLAAGAVLWFTAPRSNAAQVGVGPGGLQVKGTW